MTDTNLSLDARLGPFTVEGMALADQIFDLVGSAIVDGVLEPGEKVNDKEVAAALGISRTPVREALQRLTWVGLVEVSPSRYTRVTQVTDDDVLSTLEHIGMQASTALQFAMRRMSADELVEAVSFLDRMIAASRADDSDALMAESQAFIGFLVAKSGNSVFIRMMSETNLLVARNLRHVRQQEGSAAMRAECFEEMRNAMLLGDADAAERWFRTQHGVGVDTAL